MFVFFLLFFLIIVVYVYPLQQLLGEKEFFHLLLIYLKGIVSDICSNMDKFITSSRMFFLVFSLSLLYENKKYSSHEENYLLSRGETILFVKIIHSSRGNNIFSSQG
jgi:hypothetical protein